MAYDIGPKIGIEGEKQFRKSISDINNTMRTLKTEMVAVASQFDENDDSTEALAAKNEVLNKQIDLQKKKLVELKKGLEQAADKYGENDRVTQGWKQSVNKATADLNDMERKLKKSGNSMDDLSRDMKDTEKSTRNLTEKLGNLGGKLAEVSKNAASGAVKSLGSGISNITKGVTKGITSSMLAVGAAATTAVGGIFKFSNDSVKAMNDLQAKTGATKEEMEEFSDVANSIYANNFGESMEDVANTMSRIKQLIKLSGDELKDASTYALLLRDVFEFEVEESTRAVDTLMKTFGIDAKRAYELVAIGAQNGANKNDDLIDTLNEYSSQYKALGLDENMFIESLIEGAESGAWSIDKVGDAIKEFNIRAKDLSDSSYSAFGSLGLDADDMFEKFSEGGAKAKAAFQTVVHKLNELEDPLEKNNIGVQLFGTQFEDLEAGILDVFANLDGKIGESEQTVRSMTDVLQNMSDIKYNDLGSAAEGLKRSVINGLSGVTDIAKNAVQGIVKGIQEGDWSKVSTSFTEGFTGVLNGLLPQVSKVSSMILNTLVTSLGTLLPQVLPTISAAMLTLVTTIVTVLSQNGEMLTNSGLLAITEVINGIVEAIPKLVPVAMQIVDTLVNAMVTEGPKIVESILNVITTQGPILLQAGATILTTLINGIIQSLPQMTTTFITMMNSFVAIITTEAPKIISAITTALIENGPQLIEAGLSALMSIISGIVDNLPLILDAAIVLLMALVNGIIENLPQLVTAAVNLIMYLLDAVLELLPMLVPAAIEAVVTLAQGIIDALPELISRVPKIIETIMTVLAENIPLLIKSAGDIVIALVEGIITNLPLIIKSGYKIIPALISGIISLLSNIGSVPKQIFDTLVDTLGDIEWASLGRNIMEGLRNGVVNAASSVISSVTDAVDGALKAAKDFLGINSPSKVMQDEVGMMIGAGLAKGITDSTKEVNTAMRTMNNKLKVKGSADFTTNSNNGGNSNSSSTQKVEHSGTITVKGVNDKGELIKVIDVAIRKKLDKEERS